LRVGLSFLILLTFNILALDFWDMWHQISEEKITFVNQSNPFVPLLERSYDRAKLMPVSPVSGGFDPLAPLVREFLFPEDITRMTPLEIVDVITLPLLVIERPLTTIKVANKVDDVIRAERIVLEKIPRSGEWIEAGVGRQEIVAKTLSYITKDTKVFPSGQFEEVKLIIEDNGRWLKFVNREDDVVYFLDSSGKVFYGKVLPPFRRLKDIMVKIGDRLVPAYEFIKSWIKSK